MKFVRAGQAWEINLADNTYLILILKRRGPWCRYLDLETGEQGDILTMKLTWAEARRIA